MLGSSKYNGFLTITLLSSLLMLFCLPSMASVVYADTSKAKTDTIIKKSVSEWLKEYEAQCKKFDETHQKITGLDKQFAGLNTRRIELYKKLGDILEKYVKNNPGLEPDSLTAIGTHKPFVDHLNAVRKLSIDSIKWAQEINVHKSLRDTLAAKKGEIGKQLQSHFLSKIGGNQISIGGTKYLYFISDTAKHHIDLHFWSTRDSSIFSNFKKLKSHLDTVGDKKLLMLTNAGMFTPKMDPEGLYISASRDTFFELDRENPKTGENFYLMPNGVFFVDQQGRSQILGSSEWISSKLDTSKVRCATQSGPMLLINGKPHPAFSYASSNRKIRSGVGVNSENPFRTVFLCTETDANFMDFAEVFKYVFGCNNALFLDGAISEMYLKGINTLPEGKFGPIISVTEK